MNKLKIGLVLSFMAFAAACNDSNAPNTGALTSSPTPSVSPTATPTPTATPVPTATPTAVSTGVWNGQDASMTLTNTGGTVHLKCANGTINQPLMMNANGDFDVQGTVTLIGLTPMPSATPAGTPVPSPTPNNTFTARYFGNIQNDVMTLNVTIPTNPNVTYGPTDLTFGGSEQVIPCNFMHK